MDKLCPPLSNLFSVLSFDSESDKEEPEPLENSKRDAQKEHKSPSSSSSFVSKASTRKESAMGKGKRRESRRRLAIACQSSSAELAVPSEKAGMGSGEDGELEWPLVWIDLEMSGLDIEKDRILELACVITDGKLEKMIEGPDLIINQPDELLANMGEWCQTQHSASGLVDAVRKSKVTEEEAEQQVLEFVHRHIGTMQPLLAGNSVYVDFMFLKKYMPSLAALFSHVVVDVSSIKALCIRWYRKDAKRAPSKKKQHRALEDIKESIVELRYMQQTIFKKI